MKINMVFVFVAAFAATSCVFVNLSDTCRFASKPPLYQSNLEELTFVVGYPSQENSETPYLVLYGPTGESELTVKLASMNGPYQMPREYDENQCRGVKLHAFKLEVETDVWDSYWTAVKERRKFNVGVAFPGLGPPVRSGSIGFAFVDNSTQKSAASCGCLAE